MLKRLQSSLAKRDADDYEDSVDDSIPPSPSPKHKSLDRHASRAVRISTQEDHPIYTRVVDDSLKQQRVLALEKFQTGMIFVPEPGVAKAPRHIPGAMAPPIRWSNVNDLPNNEGNDAFTYPSTVPNGGIVIHSQPYNASVPPIPEAGAVPHGDLDHAKWVSYTEFYYPPPEDGSEVRFEANISSQTFNTENNPFGPSFIEDPDDDPRLAFGSLTTRDLENLVIAQVAMTNKGIYAIYQRLDRNRTRNDFYGAFSYMVRVGDRKAPDAFTKVAVGWTKDAIHWYVEGKQVFRVSKIGCHLIGPDHYRYIAVENGGKDQVVRPVKVVGGLNTFTFLDAFRPNRLLGNNTSIVPLVKLSDTPGYYRNPFVAGPYKAPPVLPDSAFVDPENLPTSRLFESQGARSSNSTQGAVLEARDYVISLYSDGRRGAQSKQSAIVRRG